MTVSRCTSIQRVSSFATIQALSEFCDKHPLPHSSQSRTLPSAILPSKALLLIYIPAKFPIEIIEDLDRGGQDKGKYVLRAIDCWLVIVFLQLEFSCGSCSGSSYSLVVYGVLELWVWHWHGRGWLYGRLAFFSRYTQNEQTEHASVLFHAHAFAAVRLSGPSRASEGGFAVGTPRLSGMSSSSCACEPLGKLT